MTKGLLNRFTGRSREILKENLVGVYLHGSAAMGCFNPEKSDIDLIVVVEEPVPDPVKRRYMDMVVELNAQGPAKGIEMSVVRRQVCSPFVYPTPFELHFSAGHLAWYLRDPEGYVHNMKGCDKDLAAHFTILRKRGRCLYGAPIGEVFSEVPAADYMDSIWNDVAGAEEEIGQAATYFTLNLARVLAYGEEGLVLSKKEGGEWALGHLPENYRLLIESALNEYTENAPAAVDEALAADYARYMLGRIKRCDPPR